jgi:hypothetical protein
MKSLTMKRFWSISLLVIAAALSIVNVVPVAANGAPVTIFLNYMPGVSNWGSQTASGAAVVAVGDGEVALEVTGLPRLTDEHYEVWLESRETRDLYSVGKFNVDLTGIGRLNVLLDTLPYQEYRMLLISVESDPDPDPAISERRSLAGLFPNEAVVQITSPITTATPEAAERPAYLPVTGEELSGEAPTWGLGLAAVLFLSAVLAIFLLRKENAI